MNLKHYWNENGITIILFILCTLMLTYIVITDFLWIIADVDIIERCTSIQNTHTNYDWNISLINNEVYE